MGGAAGWAAGGTTSGAHMAGGKGRLFCLYSGRRCCSSVDLLSLTGIEAEIPGGVPENVVRTVTENSRTLQVHQPGLRGGVA